MKFSKQTTSASSNKSLFAEPELVEPPKQYKLSYCYAVLAAIFFGLSSVFFAEVAKIGFVCNWTMWLGNLLPFLIYHAYQFLVLKSKGEAYFNWTKCNYVIAYKNEEATDADEEH